MKRLAASLAIAATGIARLVTHHPHRYAQADTVTTTDTPVTQAVDAREFHAQAALPPIVVSRSYVRHPPTTGARRVLTVTWAASWRALVAQLFGPAAPTAFRVIQCESGGNPNAHNPSGATGLFQILEGPYDPTANVEEAFRMWQQRGWEPWAASEHCWAA